MDEDAEILVELCSEENVLDKKTLHFPSFPSTFGSIKEKIEECCSIPVCVQTMWYQSVQVPDECNPSTLYMRSGDTVKVTYPHQGECEMVQTVVQWLAQVIPIVRLCKEAGAEELAIITNEYGDILGDEEMPGVLSRKLFYPWTEKTKQVNCSHFSYLHGVDLLITLHRHVTELRKCNDLESACYLSTFYELICCQAVANYAMDFRCRRELAKCHGLEQCIESFLIKPADDDSLLFNHSFFIVDVALYAICNISEIPEVQKWISEKSEVIQQALLVGKKSRYTCNTATMAVSLLLCLTQSPEAHVNLLKPEIVSGIVEVCSVRREELATSDSGEICEVMALECYAAVVLAQMVCGSTSLLQSFPLSTLNLMASLMEKVCSYDPDEIRTYEINQGLVWGTFLPYLTFLYSPDRCANGKNYEESSSMAIKLRHLACHVLLHCLQNALGRQSHVDTLVEEDLLDFLVAMVWNVPSECRERARMVYREVTKFQKIQPPSLGSLAKAKLAKTEWGLKKIRDMQSISYLLNSTL